MKTKEKLTASKEIAENVSRKFRELTDEELEQVAGGNSYSEQQVPHSLGLYDSGDTTPGAVRFAAFELKDAAKWSDGTPFT